MKPQAGYVLLRLPGSVAGVFEHRLRAAFPLRADKIMRRIAETRGDADAGKLYDSRWGTRQTGQGDYASMIGKLFATTVARLGLDQRSLTVLSVGTFRRPVRAAVLSPQMTLF